MLLRGDGFFLFQRVDVEITSGIVWKTQLETLTFSTIAAVLKSAYRVVDKKLRLVLQFLYGFILFPKDNRHCSIQDIYLTLSVISVISVRRRILGL